MTELEPVYTDFGMAKVKPVYADYGNVPLPYLIRPRRKELLPPCDILDFHKDSSSDDESDENDSSMEAVETSPLNEDNCFGNRNESDSLTDEEYVVVNYGLAMPHSKTEKAGAIQMMELSKDTIDESESDNASSKSDESDNALSKSDESDNASSKSDDWVVV